MNRFVRLFYRRFYWFTPLWYGFTSFLTRFRRWPPLPGYKNAKEIAEAINWGKNWRPDPLKGVLDVMMDPRKFQSRLDAGDKEYGDCDDYAIYWCTALLQSELADRAWFGSIWYAKPGEKASGHAVCVFERDGLRYWCDYKEPRIAIDMWEWARDVAALRGRIALAAGMTEVKLRKRSGAPKFIIRGSKSTVFPTE